MGIRGAGAAPTGEPNAGNQMGDEGAAPTGEPNADERVSRGEETGRAPAWAQPDFPVQLFEVGRLTLAMPLLKLYGVVPWREPISAIPNQPRWCHGMFRYHDRDVAVIDTERLVLPKGHQRPDQEAADAAHILLVGDGRWGVACRSVGEVIRLTPEEVKWRSDRGRRPWLAGTVLNRRCAVMDTEAFAAMFSEVQPG